jgi:hypothetical protein
VREYAKDDMQETDQRFKEKAQIGYETSGRRAESQPRPSVLQLVAQLLFTIAQSP